MGIYNRARIIILDTNIPIRDGIFARKKYDPVFTPMGARYAGYTAHSYGKGIRPAYFYMIDNPTDQQLSDVLILSSKCPTRHGFEIRIVREYKGADSVEYDLTTIMSDVAAVVHDQLIGNSETSSNVLARCWSGVSVMEKMLKTTL